MQFWFLLGLLLSFIVVNFQYGIYLDVETQNQAASGFGATPLVANPFKPDFCNYWIFELDLGYPVNASLLRPEVFAADPLCPLSVSHGCSELEVRVVSS